MKKFKFFLDFGKEEQWLNKMGSKGYRFQAKHSFGIYSFCTVGPKDTTIRIDYRTFKNQADFLDYQSLFEDSGWKHIAGSKTSGSQYFTKLCSGADEDIFSDKVSRAGRYKRLSNMWISLFSTFLPFMIVLIYTDSINIKAFLNPKLLYYTPGLWEKTASDFWFSFLFETPFAFMRWVSWLVIPVTITLYLYFAIKSFIYYKQTLINE